MVLSLPAGVSALPDPADEIAMSILEHCAEERRRLGLPTYTRDDLERLFRVLDAPAPQVALPPNVIRFPAGRRCTGARTPRR